MNCVYAALENHNFILKLNLELIPLIFELIYKNEWINFKIIISILFNFIIKFFKEKFVKNKVI
jgi:hypothetical protein